MPDYALECPPDLNVGDEAEIIWAGGNEENGRQVFGHLCTCHILEIGKEAVTVSYDGQPNKSGRPRYAVEPRITINLKTGFDHSAGHSARRVLVIRKKK